MHYKIAHKDHSHFTNLCCHCNKHKNDSDMLAVWVSRISGLEPKSYFEPDYICKPCNSKLTLIKLEPFTRKG